MEKYAKIINEETKLCEVGSGNPEKILEERIIPEKSHEEVIPAEYDEAGNLIKDEEIIKVIDEEEHIETITVGDWYKSLGMEEMEVEKAYDGSWYVAGFVPEKPALTHEEISELREQAYIKEVDILHAQRQRKTILGTWTEQDETNYIEQVKQLSEDIANRYPYPTEE